MFLLRVQEREESAPRQNGTGEGKRRRRRRDGGGSERRKGRSNPVFVVVVVDPRVRETTAGGVEKRFKFSPLRFRAGWMRWWRGGKCLNFSLSKISR